MARSPGPRPSPRLPRLAPAQNAGGAPVTTTAPTPSSASKRSMAATISATIGAVSELRSAGLFRVRVATRSAMSTSTRVTAVESATTAPSAGRVGVVIRWPSPHHPPSLPRTCSITSSPTPSPRSGKRSKRRCSSARRSRSTSRSTCCSATSRGRRATASPVRASRPRGGPHHLRLADVEPDLLPALVRRRGARRAARHRDRDRLHRPAPGRSARSQGLHRHPARAEPAHRQRAPRAQPAPTAEIAYETDLSEAPSYAIEVSYEGLYELAEETLADGSSSLLDEHFGALGGWIGSMLVRLGRPASQVPYRPRRTADG